MRIGEIAKRTQASARSIGHYDNQGLLDVTRAENGYREFSPLNITRVSRIQKLLQLGFTTEEIRALAPCLDQASDEEQFCTHLLDLYEQKLAELNQRIMELQTVRQHLTEQVTQLGYLRDTTLDIQIEVTKKMNG